MRFSRGKRPNVLFFEYGTQSGRTGGGGAFAGSRYQDTPTRPFAADGTSHPWKLVYDPAANNNLGEITFQVDQRVFRLSLNPGDREDGAELNRFGFWNQQTTGGGMEVWLDDLILNGRPYPFDHDPGWQGQGNNIEFTEAVVRPFHDFGYSPSSHTGGTAGEIGGIIWRDEQPCYYADHVGPLSLEDELRASGKIAFSAAGADSAVYIGWFHAQTKRTNQTPEHQARQRQYLGILLEGPSRIGHFFRPGYSTKTGSGFNAAEGPVFNPDDKVHHWSVHYQPQAAGGRGQITVTLDDQSKSIVLTAGDRETGAVFDRFGLFNMQTGGWHVRVFLDDLTYTCHARCVAGCSLQ